MQESPRSKPDSNVGETADLTLENRKKNGAGEESRTPDLILGKLLNRIAYKAEESVLKRLRGIFLTIR